MKEFNIDKIEYVELPGANNHEIWNENNFFRRILDGNSEMSWWCEIPFNRESCNKVSISSSNDKSGLKKSTKKRFTSLLVKYLETLGKYQTNELI